MPYDRWVRSLPKGHRLSWDISQHRTSMEVIYRWVPGAVCKSRALQIVYISKQKLARTFLPDFIPRETQLGVTHPQE